MKTLYRHNGQQSLYATKTEKQQ